MVSKGEIIVLIGCSGSGKSTWVHKKWRENPQKTTIVSRDKVRELLFGYTYENVKEYYDREDFWKCEKKVSKYVDTLIHDALCDDDTVIIDATHLKRKYFKDYYRFGVSVSYRMFDIDLKTLIDRDRNRDRTVGEEVIKKQYDRFQNIKKNPPQQIKVSDYNMFEYTRIDRPNCTIFDIDGTLSKKGDRDIYDGSKVHLDELILPVYNVLKNVENVIICTGRSDKFRSVTEKWLKNKGICYKETHFRKEGDYRPDWKVKEGMWRDIETRYKIEAMYDDRNQVVRRARALGYKVFQVEYGNF